MLDVMQQPSTPLAGAVPRPLGLILVMLFRLDVKASFGRA
jgi:hypothetical protein